MRWMLVLVIVAGGCKKSGAKCDVSTDKGVAAAYKQIQGKGDDGGHCVRRSVFPGYAYDGIFAPDAGCVDDLWIWQCRKSTDADIPAILQSVGWKTTDDAGRTKIARDWLDLGGGPLESLNAEQTKAFADAGKTFTPPIIAAKDGTVHVEAWYDESHVSVAGMIPHFSHVVTYFAADGSLKGTPDDEFPPRGPDLVLPQ